MASAISIGDRSKGIFSRAQAEATQHQSSVRVSVNDSPFMAVTSYPICCLKRSMAPIVIMHG